MKLSVVIPVYNEKDTLLILLDRVKNVPFDKEIILVEDFSTDGTREILQKLAEEDASLKCVFHEENKGKGAAIATGFKQVEGDIVIIQDADLEYNPAEYQVILAPILDGRADIVYGSRFLGSPQRVHLFWHYVGNKLFTLFSNIFTNKNMSDIESCYKVFRSFLLTSMPIDSSGFGFEVEVTAKVSKTRARMYEAPISYHGRTYDQGKKISYVDGLAALWYILRYNLVPGAATRSYIIESNRKLGRL
jgi:glycosyltransferase involved in cell wall biosynthesis